MTFDKNEDLVKVARSELPAILAWIRNSYVEEQPLIGGPVPTEEEVLMALENAIWLNRGRSESTE